MRTIPRYDSLFRALAKNLPLGFGPLFSDSRMESMHQTNLRHKSLHILLAIVASFMLLACGGGNKESTVPTASTPTTPVTPASVLPTVALVMKNAAGTVASSITAADAFSLYATVRDASGASLAGQVVTFAGDTNLFKFSPATTALTDANGVALVQVSPATASSAGAAFLTADVAVNGTAASQARLGVAVVASGTPVVVPTTTLALTDLTVGTASLPAFGSRPVSVTAKINGENATSAPVSVTFSASCGSITPSVVSTDATGVANTTYTASLANCSGSNVTISAAAVGSATVSGTILVAPSVVSNVLFVSSTPQLIYLKDSVGVTQAQVAFKVVDASGNALPNKKLQFTLSNLDTGVTLDTLGNTKPVDLTTDSSGMVSLAVFAGTVPTALNVRATLLDASNNTTGVFSNSNQLTVASGRPVQKSLSLALEKMSLEAQNRDGQTTLLTLSLADRQGNPVPPGTQVNFVTETGVVQPASCVVPSITPPESFCSVTFRSSGTRTASGKVSIMAYVSGEEDFVDTNGNNVYDSGEPFADLGRAFRDDHGQSIAGADGKYNSGEFQVPRVGTSACVDGNGCQGDGVWGAADVRTQATVILASGKATFSPATAPNSTGFDVTVANKNSDLVGDANNTSVPTGSEILVSVTDNTSTNDLSCTVSSPSNITVANSINALVVPLSLTACATGDAVTFKVTTPLGTVTQIQYLLP